MDHDALNRKLAHLEEEISLAQSAKLHGSAKLSKAALTLDDAIRVAANIRNRLTGALRRTQKPGYNLGDRTQNT